LQLRHRSNGGPLSRPEFSAPPQRLRDRPRARCRNVSVIAERRCSSLARWAGTQRNLPALVTQRLVRPRKPAPRITVNAQTAAQLNQRAARRYSGPSLAWVRQTHCSLRAVTAQDRRPSYPQLPRRPKQDCCRELTRCGSRVRADRNPSLPSPGYHRWLETWSHSRDLLCLVNPNLDHSASFSLAARAGRQLLVHRRNSRRNEDFLKPATLYRKKESLVFPRDNPTSFPRPNLQRRLRRRELTRASQRK
jgi:hypothetical protein